MSQNCSAAQIRSGLSAIRKLWNGAQLTLNRVGVEKVAFSLKQPNFGG